jgi:hypothetical protein
MGGKKRNPSPLPPFVTPHTRSYASLPKGAAAAAAAAAASQYLYFFRVSICIFFFRESK